MNQENLITIKELQEMIKNHVAFQLVDVRTPEKHASFNIGGQLIPFETLPHRINELNKEIPIVTYCTSGNRSMRALEYLKSVGFTDVKSLDGGMTAWQALSSE